jgi:hypothetical protein
MKFATGAAWKQSQSCHSVQSLFDNYCRSWIICSPALEKSQELCYKPLHFYLTKKLINNWGRKQSGILIILWKCQAFKWRWWLVKVNQPRKVQQHLCGLKQCHIVTHCTLSYSNIQYCWSYSVSAYWGAFDGAGMNSLLPAVFLISIRKLYTTVSIRT